ncbi:hypothetical protein DCAR_0935556 [Daucus carota subsp. sativus]|uniref:Uncharacterized protein n=1 Tax=Daucus carota subsp. sativus TaxID=79200 RepID=A0AAF0XZ04_DAUCS|nr:hypothetical protein DCAR_0935556 [Daucus carota subsp. sativus]
MDQDDIFFADLDKQISLLIMDDDDDDDDTIKFPPFSRVIHPRPPTQSQMFYEQSCITEQSKGTGVFFPRSTQPRRKNRQGRFTTRPSNTKFQKHSDDNSRDIPHGLPYNNYKFSFNHNRN